MLAGTGENDDCHLHVDNWQQERAGAAAQQLHAQQHESVRGISRQ